jgi:hypothetical protein
MRLALFVPSERMSVKVLAAPANRGGWRVGLELRGVAFRKVVETAS